MAAIFFYIGHISYRFPQNLEKTYLLDAEIESLFPNNRLSLCLDIAYNGLIFPYLELLPFIHFLGNGIPFLEFELFFKILYFCHLILFLLVLHEKL